MNTIEQIIFTFSEPIAKELSCEIVQVKTFGNKSLTVQIMIDKVDNTKVSADDCAKFSRKLAKILDEKDPISGQYFLEVSSPGINRPLTKIEDYVRFVGESVNVKLASPLQEELEALASGQKNFQGTILNVENNIVTFSIEGKEIKVNFLNIDKANLNSALDIAASGGLNGKK